MNWLWTKNEKELRAVARGQRSFRETMVPNSKVTLFKIQFRFSCISMHQKWTNEAVVPKSYIFPTTDGLRLRFRLAAIYASMKKELILTPRMFHN